MILMRLFAFIMTFSIAMDSSVASDLEDEVNRIYVKSDGYSSVAFKLLPDGIYESQSAGCLGLYETVRGAWRETSDGLVLDPLESDNHDSHLESWLMRKRVLVKVSTQDGLGFVDQKYLSEYVDDLREYGESSLVYKLVPEDRSLFFRGDNFELIRSLD